MGLGENTVRVSAGFTSGNWKLERLAKGGTGPPTCTKEVSGWKPLSHLLFYVGSLPSILLTGCHLSQCMSIPGPWVGSRFPLPSLCWPQQSPCFAWGCQKRWDQGKRGMELTHTSCPGGSRADQQWVLAPRTSLGPGVCLCPPLPLEAEERASVGRERTFFLLFLIGFIWKMPEPAD